MPNILSLEDLDAGDLPRFIFYDEERDSGELCQQFFFALAGVRWDGFLWSLTFLVNSDVTLMRCGISSFRRQRDFGVSHFLVGYVIQKPETKTKKQHGQRSTNTNHSCSHLLPRTSMCCGNLRKTFGFLNE